MENTKKAELLEKGTYQKYIETRKKAFQNNDFSNVPVNGFITREQENHYGIPKETIEDCERIRRAKKNQRNRIEEHIAFMMGRGDIDVYFVTFTFNDEALQLKKETRKQTLRRILSCFDDYILNIDYGKENKREHYHAVLSAEKEAHEEYTDTENHTRLKSLDNYKLGFYYVEKVQKKGKSKEKLSRYITKLTMHSVKVKQQYVSTKKGSRWQMFKKANDMLSEMSKKTTSTYKGLDQFAHPSAYLFEKRLKKESEKKNEMVQMDLKI